MPKFKKLSLVLLLSFCLVGSIALASSVRAISTSEIQALIDQIKAQIAQLQAQLLALSPSSSTPAWCHTFNSNLGFANSGSPEVSALHTALGKENISSGTDDATTYAEDTAAAVVLLQAKYGIRQTGYVGPLTRAKLNSLYGCSNPTQIMLPPVTTDGTQATNIPAGACQLRDAYTSIPSYTAPDSGKGYAKLQKNGSRTVGTILSACSADDFATLLKNYCATNNNPVQQEVVVYSEGGGVVSASCVNNLQCERISCPTTTSTQPSITVTLPQANDVWEIGKKYTISWSVSSPSSGYCSIYMTQNGVSGSKYLGTSSNCNSNGGSYEYTVSSLVNSPGSWNLWVCGRYCSFDGGFGVSKPITIIPSSGTGSASPLSLTVLSPNGGEVLNNNQTYNIRWQSSNFPVGAKVQIQLIDETNPTTIQYMISDNIVSASAGSYSWSVPTQLQKPFEANSTVLSGNKFRIFVTYTSSISNDQARDLSDSYFTISSSSATQPSITVNTTINGVSGQTIQLQDGQHFTLAWTSTNATSCFAYANGNLMNNVVLDGVANNFQGQTSASILGQAMAVKFPITYKVVCSNAAGQQTSSSITVQVSSIASITSSSQQTSLAPTISGTATGMSQVGVVLQYSSGDKAYGSGLISVSNGTWSVTVSPALTAGQYMVYIYDAQNNLKATGSLIISSPTTNSTLTSNGGACILRDAYASAPAAFAANVGAGYAKTMRSSATSYADTLSQCTQSVFNDLLANYCAAGNKNPAQQGVVYYGQSSTAQTSGCGPDAFNCVSRTCP